jgi:glycosyltransferase involved in cell wall biosynthesis
MKILTFGWDYPPSRNGGLGVACYGLTRELLAAGVAVVFVLPRRQATIPGPRFRFADEVTAVGPLKEQVILPSYAPYQSSGSEVTVIVGYDERGHPLFHRRTILEEVHRFAHRASMIAREEQCDIIHAHDWTSYLAGVAAKIATRKPLILHVHATSFDQAASSNVDPEIYKIECEAFAQADTIVTVSHFTKRIIVERHGVPPERVVVVHNGCDVHEPPRHEPTLKELKDQGKRIVLYHGRITIQKGVDYFVRAARRVVDVDNQVVFIISGWGDMTRQIIEQVGAAGLSGHVLFAGALWDDERDRMYQSADLVVMPSVSEPFGLVPLEALLHGTPSLISKQSGVSEVVSHVLKVDFWDVDEMANKILAALRYPVMRQQLVTEGKQQLTHLSWSFAAQKLRTIFMSLLHYMRA